MLTALGCNIFAGGFTLGVERHFRVLGHLEHDGYGVGTFKLNRPHVPVWQGRGSWPLERFRDRVDLLYANPPCAIVSVCGGGLRGPDAWRDDPRTERWRDVVDLAVAIRPRVLAVESVTELHKNARALLDEQALKLRAAGYHTTHLLVNNCWHGVPQNRRRYYLMAAREPLRFETPNWAPPATVGEVLREVADPGPLRRVPPALLAALAVTAPGRNPRKAAAEAGLSPLPAFLWHRLRMDELARPVISRLAHPTEPRPLGYHEILALSGFPADFKVHRPDGDAAIVELQRGVMPPMGDWLARQVASSLTLPGADHRAFVETVDLRVPPTQPEMFPWRAGCSSYRSSG